MANFITSTLVTVAVAGGLVLGLYEPEPEMNNDAGEAEIANAGYGFNEDGPLFIRLHPDEGEAVEVTGWSKGKGFQGVVKRHGFGGGPKTHGQSDRLRAPGSLGQSSYPSRVFKGIRMGGRTGGDRVTIKKRKVVKVFPEKNIVMIQGSVPGATQSLVLLKN